MNHCIFCGASGQEFPFEVQDTENRYLYDILEFRNVEIPEITAGNLNQNWYYTGFSFGSASDGGMMVLYDPAAVLTLPTWVGSQITSISTTSKVIPKGTTG